MIDTKKYEGHTEGPWKHNDKWGLIKYGQIEIAALHSGNSANAQLIADAPLLLAEVKRLRLDLASGRITTIVNPNDDHNRTLYVTIEFPDGEVYRGYVEKEGDEE